MQAFTQSTSQEGGQDLRPQHCSEHARRWACDSQTLPCACDTDGKAIMTAPAISMPGTNLEAIDMTTLQRTLCTQRPGTRPRD
jgi:hypothetical protein